MPNGKITTSDVEKAETLNEHFANVFTIEDTANIPIFVDRGARSTLETVNITVEETSKVIKQIKPDKAQGPDNIHPRVVKECSETIVTPLTAIFRKSLNEQELPKIWKTANVTAIFKAGNKTLPENYRPISITPICCRIMEKNIKEQNSGTLNGQ